MKTLIIGNTGSGKSVLAERLVGVRDIPRRSLDEAADSVGGVRHLVDSLRALWTFIEQNDQWVIEGCHCDLVESALPHCTELRFLNPGVEACINRFLSGFRGIKRVLENGDRETDYDRIICQIGKYDYRDDGYGLERHRELFESFPGPKKEYSVVV